MDYSMALKSDGTVVAWGLYLAGLPVTAADPPPSSIAAITASSRHCVALTRDGSVVDWGDIYDNWRQMPALSSFRNVLAAASCGDYILGLVAVPKSP